MYNTWETNLTNGEKFYFAAWQGVTSSWPQIDNLVLEWGTEITDFGFVHAGETVEFNNGSKIIFSPITTSGKWNEVKVTLLSSTGEQPSLKITLRKLSSDGTNQGNYYFAFKINNDEIPTELGDARFGFITRDEKFQYKSGSAINGVDFFSNMVGSGVVVSDDPYNPGGNTGVGGGGGDFDNNSTPIDFPPLPTISVVSTGFVTLYCPTLSQLNELSSYMWSDLFDIEGWKKLFADPMDAILGLSIVPVSVPTSGPSEVNVGNISTGISLNRAMYQYVEVDCGTINVNEYWGAYLDYSPYTKCEIFLPYVGTRPLSIDDIMNKTVHVKYHVDILSGGLTCFVKCGDSVLYSFIGQCSCSIPINSANYTNMLNGVLSIAGSIGSTVATGGMMAPATAATVTTTAFNMMKPEIQKSGAMSGAGAMVGMQVPYLILTRPRQALPTNQNKFSGYPSLITVQLSELSGYTEVEKIHLENIPATEVELTELEKLLMGGVIF